MHNHSQGGSTLSFLALVHFHNMVPNSTRSEGVRSISFPASFFCLPRRGWIKMVIYNSKLIFPFFIAGPEGRTVLWSQGQFKLIAFSLCFLDCYLSTSIFIITDILASSHKDKYLLSFRSISIILLMWPLWGGQCILRDQPSFLSTSCI